ncbi:MULTISPECIES: MFS transporter [Paenibacillus]|uniref:MFS transporter n=1 Tax=Paenibacillus albilobatus TaxID=2716884 RepID=A0A920C8E7_9BACL|nr:MULTISPECIES: MFS transporter [Paenibacillus]GIO30026.1 MFS transporter [Paenibacillus albilobatus]
MGETVLVQSQPRQGIRALRAHPSYLIMIAAKIISRFGDSVDSIAYSWMVYMLTGSEVLMGTLFAVNFIPGIALSPFTGVLVDRWSKKKVVIVAGTGRGATVTLTALLYFTGHLEAWHLFVFTVLNSTFECFSTPAEMSLVPRLLPKELLLTGNSLTSSVSRTAELGGMAAAGGLIAFVGISGTMVIDAATFLIEALLFFFIRPNPAEKPADEPHGDTGEDSRSSYWKQFLSGLRFVGKKRLILLTMLAGAFVNLCLCPWNVLQPVYVKEVLHAGPFGLSLLGITLVVGMILSGLWISQKGNRYKKSTLIVFGFLLLGVTYSLLYFPAFIAKYPLYAASLFSFGMGFAISFVNTPISTYTMEVTPQNMLGRIGALSGMIATCTIPLGGVIAGFAGTWMSANTVFLVFGLLMILPGLALLTQKSFMSL